MRNLTTAFICFLLAQLLPFSSATANDVQTKRVPDKNWTIIQKLTGMQHETGSGITSRYGVSMQGLVSVGRNGGKKLITYVEDGASESSIRLDEHVLFDGKKPRNKSRIWSVRLSAHGDIAYLETATTRGFPLYLMQNGKPVMEWPTRSRIKFYEFNERGALLAQTDRTTAQTTFYRIPLDDKRQLDKTRKEILGTMKDCAIHSVKSLSKGLLIERTCSVYSGLTFTTMKPALKMPAQATGYCNTFGSMIATRSPFSKPRLCR